MHLHIIIGFQFLIPIYFLIAILLLVFRYLNSIETMRLEIKLNITYLTYLT